MSQTVSIHYLLHLPTALDERCFDLFRVWGGQLREVKELCTVALGSQQGHQSPELGPLHDFCPPGAGWVPEAADMGNPLLWG